MYFGVSSDPAVEEVRDAFPALGCGLCKFFKVGADRGESLCKRLDHKRVQFARPWFKDYDCGQFTRYMCADFSPRPGAAPALERIWCGTDAYVGDIPDTDMISLVLNGNTDVRYRVQTKDFYDGSFSDGDSIRCVEKAYYKVSRKSPTGYTLVTEHYDQPKMICFGADDSKGVKKDAV